MVDISPSLLRTCSICFSTSETVTNCKTHRLPSSDQPVSEKLERWQRRYRFMFESAPGNFSRFVVEQSCQDGSYKLCFPCLELVTEIDQLETGLQQKLECLWLGRRSNMLKGEESFSEVQVKTEPEDCLQIQLETSPSSKLSLGSFSAAESDSTNGNHRSKRKLKKKTVTEISSKKMKRNGRKRDNHVSDAVSKLTLHCDTCGKGYATPVGLAYHKARAHKGPDSNMPYSCDKCGEGFETSGDLCKHKQHSDCGVEYEKFPCLKCVKQFSTKNALR